MASNSTEFFFYIRLQLRTYNILFELQLFPEKILLYSMSTRRTLDLDHSALITDSSVHNFEIRRLYL